MPRVYDYEASQEAKNKASLQESSCFARFGQERSGRGEISLPELYGNDPMGFLRGPRHQFELAVPKQVDPYDNGLLDPIFGWLEQKVTGRWNWYEKVVNHGHGVDTRIYIEDADDREAFTNRWGHLFRVDEHAMAHNAKLEPETSAGVRP